MNIVFIAPPGAGKGTQSELLIKKYNMIHISTGNLCREEIAKQTELGKNIENLIKSGKLVSSDIITEMLKKRLSCDDIKNGFILDGYPRKIDQCRLLDNILSETNLKIDHVIYLKMDEETAKMRILGRLTCPKCNRGYNKYLDARKPKKENLCDDCNVELIGRDDDNEETFKVRFNQFSEEIKPILDFYQERELLRCIDNNGTPEETFALIESVMK